MNLFKLIGLNLILKVSYFLVFILISKFINVNFSALIEMLYSTARTISNISNAGISVYLLKNKKFDISIFVHLLLQLSIVVILYLLLIDMPNDAMFSFFIYLIPFIIVLSPYLYYYQLSYKPLSASLYKELHVYPLILFFLLSFFIDIEYYHTALNILFLFSSSIIFFYIYIIFKDINFSFHLHKLIYIYKESFIYVYSSLFIMFMNLDRLLFVSIFGIDNAKFYFSFILFILPFVLLGQLIEDYFISKKHIVKIEIYQIILISIVSFSISLLPFVYDIYQDIFLYFNLIPVSSFIFSLVLLLVALEVVKRFFYVNIVLESRYDILKYYGHSMNIFVFSVFLILYYIDINNMDYFLFFILIIYYMKNILLILLYQIKKRK